MREIEDHTYSCSGQAPKGKDNFEERQQSKPSGPEQEVSELPLVKIVCVLIIFNSIKFYSYSSKSPQNHLKAHESVKEALHALWSHSGCHQADILCYLYNVIISNNKQTGTKFNDIEFMETCHIYQQSRKSTRAQVNGP